MHSSFWSQRASNLQTASTTLSHMLPYREPLWKHFSLHDAEVIPFTAADVGHVGHRSVRNREPKNSKLRYESQLWIFLFFFYSSTILRGCIAAALNLPGCFWSSDLFGPLEGVVNFDHRSAAEMSTIKHHPSGWDANTQRFASDCYRINAQCVLCQIRDASFIGLMTLKDSISSICF